MPIRKEDTSMHKGDTITCNSDRGAVILMHTLQRQGYVVFKSNCTVTIIEEPKEVEHVEH